MTRTVKVRIALAVNEKGDWTSYGSAHVTESDARKFMRRCHPTATHFWLTAEVPVPTPAEIAGEVEEAK